MPFGNNEWGDPLGGINLPANGSNPLDPVGGRGGSSNGGSGIGCGFILPIILVMGIIGFIILIVLGIWLLI